jgi:two-component system, OmpR family, sensor kinase
MHTPSLRRRVVLSGVAVTALALLVASTAVYLVLQRALDGQLDDILDDRAELVARVAADQPELTDLARELSARGLRVTLTGPDGDIHATAPEVPRVGTNLPRPTGDEPTSLHTRTIGLPGGVTAEVGVSRDGVDLALRRLLAVELATAGLALALVAGLLARTTHTALRPLDTLVDAANSIADGDHTRRLDPDRTDTELGTAAAAFDRMLDRLEHAITTATDAQHTTRRFLDAAAHQLRTPITGAATAIQTYRHLHPNPPDRHLLDIADRETLRAGHLVHQLLRVARLDHGIDLHPTAIDLHEIIVTEADRAARRAPHLHLTLPDPTPLPAHADADATAEILANLLDNATRYATRRIDITTTTTTHHTAVHIADDGPGIPPDQHETIFERFTTLDDRSDTGLGLAIARELARAQHGELTYNGTFNLTLPTGPEQPTP